MIAAFSVWFSVSGWAKIMASVLLLALYALCCLLIMAQPSRRFQSLVRAQMVLGRPDKKRRFLAFFKQWSCVMWVFEDHDPPRAGQYTYVFWWMKGQNPSGVNWSWFYVSCRLGRFSVWCRYYAGLSVYSHGLYGLDLFSIIGSVLMFFAFPEYVSNSYWFCPYG